MIGVQGARFDAVALDCMERAARAEPDVPPVPAAEAASAALRRGGAAPAASAASVLAAAAAGAAREGGGGGASQPSSLGSDAGAAVHAAAQAWDSPSTSGESSQPCEVEGET